MKPDVIKGFLRRDPPSGIEVGHLLDKVLELGVERVALPQRERTARVLRAEGVSHATQLAGPGVPATQVIHKGFEVIPLGESRDLALDDGLLQVDARRAVDAEDDHPQPHEYELSARFSKCRGKGGKA